jgi:hypothetical protein
VELVRLDCEAHGLGGVEREERSFCQHVVVAVHRAVVRIQQLQVAAPLGHHDGVHVVAELEPHRRAALLKDIVVHREATTVPTHQEAATRRGKHQQNH